MGGGAATKPGVRVTPGFNGTGMLNVGTIVICDANAVENVFIKINLVFFPICHRPDVSLWATVRFPILLSLVTCVIEK